MKTKMMASEAVVHLVGAGGIGSWIGLFLAKAGVSSLFVYDGDRVDESNLHRSVYTPDDVGKNKAAALVAHCTAAGVDPRTLYAFGHWTPGLGTWRLGEIVICAADSSKLREELEAECRSIGAPAPLGYVRKVKGMNEEARCLICGGHLVELGWLGRRYHYRCLNCGMDGSTEAPLNTGEADEVCTDNSRTK